MLVIFLAYEDCGLGGGSRSGLDIFLRKHCRLWDLAAFKGWEVSHLEKQFLFQRLGKRKHRQPPCLHTEHLRVAW